MNRYSNFHRFFVIVGCVAIAIGLSGYIHIGSFMRYSGDDYCYGAVLIEHGFWGAQTYSYLNDVPFHGNRYSLTFFSSLASLYTPKINGMLPGLAIVLWIAGFFILIKEINKLLDFQFQNLEILLISEFIVFMTLYAAPDLPESLYWRSGMLPYLAPIILNTYLVYLILRFKPHTRSSIFVAASIILLAFINGGFSETATAMQSGLLLFWFVGTFMGQKLPDEFWKEHRIPLAFAMIGTVMAIILLVSSPAIETELLDSDITGNFILSSELSLQYAWDFINESIQGLPLPHLIILLFFASLSYVVSTSTNSPNSGKFTKKIFWGVLIIIGSYLIIACCIAPAAFVRSVKPNPRGLITTRFIMILTFATVGWVIGQVINRVSNRMLQAQKFLYFSSLLVLTLIWLYPVRAARNTYDTAPKFQKWATLWDIRDENIRSARDTGILDVEVMHLDKIIKWVGELSPNPGFWYNHCAAGYYEVESIQATISVWDE